MSLFFFVLYKLVIFTLRPVQYDLTRSKMISPIRRTLFLEFLRARKSRIRHDCTAPGGVLTDCAAVARRKVDFPQPPDDRPSNYQHLVCDRPNYDTPTGRFISIYHDDPAENDDISDTSDEIPAPHTTKIYRKHHHDVNIYRNDGDNDGDDDDDDDNDDSDLVNDSSVFSIYCPRPETFMPFRSRTDIACKRTKKCNSYK